MHNDKSIVIGILARDCDESLERNIPRVEQLGEYFSNYHVVVFENDSKDATKEVLKHWQKRNERVIAIMEDTNTETIPTDARPARYRGNSVHRIEKMAKYRNRVLDYIAVNFDDTDLFCFIDIDILSFDPKSIVDAIAHAPKDWGGLFASGIIYYDFANAVHLSPQQYDSYAYVDYGVDPMQMGLWLVSRYFNKVTRLMMHQDVKKHDYLPCHSAFNGIGIYRWKDIKDVRYGVYQSEEMKSADICLCEHVMFNMSLIKRGYKNYIVRDMVAEYQHEDKKNKTISPIFQKHPHLRFFWRYFAKYICALICRVKKKFYIRPFCKIPI